MQLQCNITVNKYCARGFITMQIIMLIVVQCNFSFVEESSTDHASLIYYLFIYLLNYTHYVQSDKG